MNGKLGKDFLKSYLEKSDPLFASYLRQKEKESQKNDPLAGDIVKRFTQIARKGKKIRGALVALGYQAAGGKVDRNIIDTSLFLELFHAAILVHDDIQDRGDMRRGIPTLHRQFEKIGGKLGVTIDKYHYGEAIAIDAGISGYFYSFEKLLAANFPKRRLIKAALLYSKYAQRVSDGQSLDITGVSSKKANEKRVLTMLRLKSAEYTGVMPFLCGAILAGIKNENKLKVMEKYGLCLGWAFQIQDDILGLYGKQEKLGKKPGSDILEGKNTLFISHLYKYGSSPQKEFAKKILGDQKATKKDIEKFLKILKDAGSYEYVVKKGWDYVNEGIHYVPRITKDKKIQEVLKSLIYYMMERTL